MWVALERAGILVLRWRCKLNGDGQS